MFTTEFDYILPPELIAQKPLPRRDASRMMIVWRSQGKIEHARFRDIPKYFNKGDVLVLNATRVIPARTWGRKGEREVEFLFLKEKSRGLWEVLCRPARHVREGDRIIFPGGIETNVVSVENEGKRVLKFSSGDVHRLLHRIGFAPLPPYIKRPERNRDWRAFDLRRYQTVYARKAGSIAAPTAGLHFTPAVLKGLRKKGVIVCFINLEVGLATFQPVREKRVEDHRMLEERYTISPAVAGKINLARREGRPVGAVGTTVVRALESAAREGAVKPGSRSTSLFIYPGFTFQVVDRLLTNFHLPRSTLLMLVSAFAGRELILRAYAEAVRERYRFHSYGDCMLIL